jgi:DNA (cytosine-5)-methyltransferase 1
MERLPTLDLFSGTGALALALAPWCETIAYCEREPACRHVLRANMLAGRLDCAPIFPDVVDLSADDVAATQPIVIAAGFPCQDISSASFKPADLDGPRSGLWRHVVRLAVECPTVDFVFLENSAQMAGPFGDAVGKEFASVGFTRQAWTLLGACDVGAPHRRQRWFFLAARPEARIPAWPGRIPVLPGWEGPEPPCIERKPACITLGRKERLRMLGNAVVPACARAAFAGVASEAMMCMGNAGFIDLRRGRRSPPQRWPTPVASTSDATVPHRDATSWGRQRIANRAIYGPQGRAIAGPDVDDEERHQKWRLNVDLTEWLIGLPAGWTDV